MPLPQLLHFTAAEFIEPRCFLRVVHAKARQESGKPYELKARGPRAQNEIPIQGIMKLFVERADRVPDSAAPKHCFLRNIIGPNQRPIVMLGKSRPPDLQTVGVDEDTVSI